MRGIVVGFLAGVCLLQTQAQLPASAWLLAGLLAGVLAIWGGRHLPPHYPAMLLKTLAGLLIGFAWAGLFANHYLDEELDPALEGQDLIVVGVVDSLPFRFDQGVRFNLRVESATRDGVPVTVPAHVALGWYAELHFPRRAAAALPVPAPTPVQVEPGERWQLSVRLQRPHGNANPDGFDFEAWLLEQDLRATGQVRTTAASVELNRRRDAFVPGFGTIVEHLRDRVRKRILAALPGREYAGAMVALVIGDQRAIAQSDWKIFNRTGIGHLVSISGLHITMIAGLFAALTHFLWRRSFFTGAELCLLLPAQKAAALAAAVTALLYVLLAGFGIPAQRTLYMLWVVAAALWCGRIGSVSHVLCIAAAVVLAIDPWAVLWPGFWLSFGAVAIILYASVGRLHDRLEGASRMARLRAQLREAARTQYVVTLGLIPLTMLLFGQVSLVSPLANAIAIPLVSLLVAPLALAGAMLPAPLSVLMLTVAHALFAWLAVLLTWLASLPAAVWAAPVPAFWMFVCALVGALWLLAPRGWPVRWVGLVGWLPLLCNTASHPADGNMTVTAFDVGQGMAVLIETAQHRLLYDTGPFYSPESDGANRVILPYLKSRGIDRLDAVIISHNDNDHSGGARSLFDDIRIDWVASSLAADSPIVLAAPAHRRCVAGQRWSWDGIEFEMLHPRLASYDSVKWKPNARSCTLKLTRGAQSMLLPGDIEAVQERELVAADADKLKSTVLLAPHHGSGTSSTLPFLQAVQPQVAIFQVGYRNRYRHPKPEIFARYADLDIGRYRNDLSGAITLQFGTTLSIGQYRSMHARYWYGR
ncbi:MAG: DNA internalization-related competence protein ComEC/Rec2 [Herminiimonas sp.]|nr:DNA internalization-related competence protein ComEC/Rec2 [Herminiimonas sp.]